MNPKGSEWEKVVFSPSLKGLTVISGRGDYLAVYILEAFVKSVLWGHVVEGLSSTALHADALYTLMFSTRWDMFSTR
ncbi:hypothetical protein NHX12_022098 [Muraenolepis orangiensis]|uniref:Uncharacterized protein n=1 Tax=Muraenolepis orangiensis TaxID=630683 RepID=A0A9Q0EMS1_9TELE|nr:hypothetical protein NHX12_022098 [Muraenolepis orangiensis]